MRDQFLPSSDVELNRISLKLDVFVMNEYVTIFVYCSEQCIDDEKIFFYNALCIKSETEISLHF